MRPLDVQGDLLRPTVVGDRRRAAAGLVHLRENRVGQAKLFIELQQIGGNVGIVVGIDDGDGLAGAVAGDAVEEDFIEAVAMADLRG